MAAVVGTVNAETIDALDGVTQGVDWIMGMGGADDIFGLGGDDNISGGNGDDTMQGGAGADTLRGGAGTDTVTYGDSNAGVTVSLITGTGTGGTAEGDDIAYVENIRGSFHNDFLVGNDQNNVLTGLMGHDTLKGSGGDDTLNGGEGNDTLKGGGGEDTLNGGFGIDTASYNESDTGVTISLADDSAFDGHHEDELNSIENITGSSHADVLSGNAAANVLKGMDGSDDLMGGDGDDTLLGGNGNDTIFGGADTDTLNGGSGQDQLDGGSGNDTVIGGAGNDWFYVSSSGDTVVEFAGEGVDTVHTVISYELAADTDVEVLRSKDLNAVTDIELTGNGLNNSVYGNEGNNVIDGAGGADFMQGRGGNDTYYVNHASDGIDEVAGGGGDVVRAALSYQLTAGASVEALTAVNGASIAPQTLIGNNFAQTIVGNAGISVLRGHDDNDQLQGMAGNDILTGDGGDDKFLFNTALNAATNVDTITDMYAGVDLIRLDDAHFAGIGALGVLNADAFHTGAAAADAEDRIVYNSATGQLFFDANGNAAGGSTLFANLDAGLALNHTDFQIV